MPPSLPARSHYSISELAHEFDITPRTIRYYEDEGLSSRPGRDDPIYSHKDKIRLKLTLQRQTARLQQPWGNPRAVRQYDTDARADPAPLHDQLSMPSANPAPANWRISDGMAELEARAALCKFLNSLKTSAD